MKKNEGLELEAQNTLNIFFPKICENTKFSISLNKI